MSESIKGRLWVRLMKRHRVERDALIECEHGDVVNVEIVIQTETIQCFLHNL